MLKILQLVSYLLLNCSNVKRDLHTVQPRSGVLLRLAKFYWFKTII